MAFTKKKKSAYIIYIYINILVYYRLGLITNITDVSIIDRCATYKI